VTPDPKNTKYTPKFYYKNNPLLSFLKNNHIKQLHSILFDENSSSQEFWAEFANKAIHGAFEQKPVFKGLCHIMLQAAERKEQDKGLQNLKYSNKRYRSILDDAINNPDLCYKNVVRFKRLLDTLHYKGPIVAMTDCMKVKSGLQFSSSLGCIVGSTLNQNDCIIKTYDDIYDKVSNKKQKNAIAKYVRVYVLQVPLPKFPSVIVALIPNGNDDSKKIFVLHQKLIEIAANLELHIISIGSDEMTSIPNDAYYFNIHKKYPISQLEDFWNNDSNLETADNNDHNEDNMNSLYISHCINNAVSEMNRSQELNLDPSPELSLEKTYGACQIIIERIQKLSDIPWFPNSRSDSILDNNLLNIKFLLNLHQHHDAHLERNLERIKFSFKNNNKRNVLNEFNNNKASSLVSHLTKNDCIITKSRENKWRSGGNTSNNISEKSHSAKFDNMLCVAQVVAMYEQDNSFHSYIDTSVSDLESLSYVSLKIFFHINGAVFSTTRDHQFYIFSHAESSHIVHYLASRDINIDEKVLILKGQAKEMFNAFKK
ncbi:5389_t:CDS:2, partial [Gigaspora margarita]